MSEQSLTGVWSGTFSLPFGLPSISFTATLIESGRFLAGTIHEPCSVAECPIKTHNAAVTGSRSGSAVAFTKAYDPPGYGYGSVAYEGALNADATEISGTWTIGPGLTGQFVMIRPARKTKARARKKEAAV